MHALIGPNGAGKSTCLNVLSGVYAASAGSVRYGGHELTRLRPHRIAALGVARTFQNIALSPRVSVLDNLLVARHRHMRSGFIADGLRLPSARRERAEHEARVREIARAARPRPSSSVPSGRCPTARANASSWPGRCAPSPSCCCSTSPSPAWSTTSPRRWRAAITQARAELGHLGAAGRARHGVRDGDGRPRHRARLRQAHRRRHPAEVQRDPEVLNARTWEARREPVRRRCSSAGSSSARSTRSSRSAS